MLEWAWARETWKWLISTTFLLFFVSKTPPGESTAAAIPALPLKTDSDSPPFFRAILGFSPLLPTPALLVATVAQADTA